MLIVVSDLHLVDSEQRASLDEAAFIHELEAAIDRCPAGEECTLVLLGDIFELLKSDRWVGTDLRPWSDSSDKLAALVCGILGAVHQRNPRFFDEINRLCRERGLRLVYVPGNHDGLMFSAGMAPLRAMVRELLPALGAADPTSMFPSSRTFGDHGVYAEHGHEFDSFNRIQDAGNRVIPGDVLVVELLSHLPIEVARLLGSDDPLRGQHDPDLRFLHGLDDVLPQEAQSLLAWLEFGLRRIPDAARQAAIESAICEAFRICLGRATDALKRDSLSSAAFGVFSAAVGAAVATGRLRLAKAAGRFAPGGVSELSGIERTAMQVTANVYGRPAEVHFIVAGHTHLPVHHPVTVTGGQVTYLNSGTWRRVLLHCPDDAGGHAFAAYTEATMVVVFRRDGSSPPRYDYRRRTFRA